MMGRKEIEKYQKVLEAKVKAEPDNSEAWRELAQSRFYLEDYDRAFEDADTAVGKDPKNVWAYILMGNIRAKQAGDLAAGLSYYKKAVEVAPDNALAINNLGGVYLKMGNGVEAVKSFYLALEKDPNLINAYLGLAMSARESGDWDSVIIHAEKGLVKGEVSSGDDAAPIYAQLKALHDEAVKHLGDKKKDHLERLGKEMLHEKEESEKSFQEHHKDGEDPQITMMMAMYMMGAMRVLGGMKPENVKRIAVEIAMAGMKGISPSKKDGYKIPSLPNEDFSGYRFLAWYYVSWAIAFPEHLQETHLPFNSAYELAKQMNGGK